MEKELIKPEDIQLLKFIESVSASPDGRFLAVSVRQIKEFKYKQNILLYKIEANEFMHLTSQDYNDKIICWSEDSSRIFFSSDREKEKKQALYSINIAGGEPEKIIELDDMSLLEWQWFSESKAVVLCQKKEIQGLKHEKETVYYEFDKPVYKQDGTGYLPKGFPQLYMLDIKSRKIDIIKSINKPKSSIWVDKQAKECCFITNLSRDIYAKSSYNDIVALNLETGKTRLLKTKPGPKPSFTMSHDKSNFAVISHFYPDEFSASRNYDLIIYNYKADDGRFINATSDIDNSVQINIVADMEQTGWFKKPLYSKDGKSIFFSVSEHASNRIYRYSSENDKSQAITATSCNVIDFDISGKFLYAIISFPAEPAELYRIDPADSSMKKISSFNESFINSKAISPPEQYSVKNKDGFDVDYWIIKPAISDNSIKYPLILNIHGGPHAQFANTFFFEFQVMASAGYAVLYSNPSGSMGKGYRFSKILERNWGNPDSEDISIIMREIAKLGYIDQERMGVTGGSYGGFLTNRLLGTTSYFKTGITERCVSNMINMSQNSDFSYYHYRIFKEKFWKNLDYYWKMSPIQYVENIKVPLLIIHSSNDQRTPIDQAEALYTALKILKKRVKLIVFPEESHGLSRGGDPRRRIERLKLFIEWFRKYL